MPSQKCPLFGGSTVLYIVIIIIYGLIKNYTFQLTLAIESSVSERMRTCNSNVWCLPINSLLRIHVRRTDKNKEERYHDLDEYMVQVEEWYRSYGRTNKVDKKRIFIATDEPKVIAEAKTKLVCPSWDKYVICNMYVCILYSIIYIHLYIKGTV